MADKPLFHASGERVRWHRGGKRAVLETYVRLGEGKIGEHWLWVAAQRMASGEPERRVMADYGYVFDLKRADKELRK